MILHSVSKHNIGERIYFDMFWGGGNNSQGFGLIKLMGYAEAISISEPIEHLKRIKNDNKLYIYYDIT